MRMEAGNRFNQQLRVLDVWIKLNLVYNKM